MSLLVNKLWYTLCAMIMNMCYYCSQIFWAYYYCSLLLSFFSSTPQSFHYTNEMKEINVDSSEVCPALKCKSIFLCTAVWVLKTFAYSWSLNPLLWTQREIGIVQSRPTATPACIDWQNDTCNDKLSNTNTLIDHAFYHYWINTMPK